MQFNNHITGVRRGKNGIGFHHFLMINPIKLNRENEIRILRHRVRHISQRLELIKKRVDSSKKKTYQNVIAVVDREECAGCGICYDVCSEGAISIDVIARIDSDKCTACLECVNQCPKGAIAIKYQNH